MLTWSRSQIYAPMALLLAVLLAVATPATAASASTTDHEPEPVLVSPDRSLTPSATVADSDALGTLSDDELAALETAMAGLSKDLLESGHTAAIEAEVIASLAEQGISLDVIGAPGDVSTQAVPIVLIARVVGCLGGSYVALRGINTDAATDVVAMSIAVAVSTCVSGGGAAVIRDAILRYPSQVATGLRAIGLGGLALALEGDTPR